MIKEFKDAMEDNTEVYQSHNNVQMQDPIVKTLMERNQKLMEMLAEKENINHNKKRTNNVGRKWVCCWAHGACSHISKNCKFKMEGHQDDATFKDRKGGSTYRCMMASVKK